MPLAHLNISVISRSDGGNAVKSAAYTCGMRLKDRVSGKTFDYRDKGQEEVIAGGVLLPDGVAELEVRELFENAEKAENRKNSRVARKIEMALPIEQDEFGQKEMAEAMAKDIVKQYGVGAAWAIHSLDGNPHCHILITTRKMNKDGTLGEKVRAFDDKIQGPKEVEAIRSRWQEIHNSMMPEALAIDMRSYRRQGLEKVAGRHFGPGSWSALHNKILNSRKSLKKAIEALDVDARALLKAAREKTLGIEPKIDPRPRGRGLGMG